MLLKESLNAGEVRIRGLDGLQFSVPDLHEPIAFHLLVDGVYEARELSFLLDRLHSGMTFLDVGASVGSFSIPAARKLRGSGRVVAIEASSQVYPYLERNVSLNSLDNVILEECAICDQQKAVAFYEAPGKNFGMGAMSPQFGAEAIQVRGDTIDNVLDAHAIRYVDVVKVDVEGFEAAVFRGARQLLTGPRPPLIMFEFCDWAEERSGEPLGAAQQVLLDWDYEIRCLRRGRLSAGRLATPLTRGFETLVARRGSGKCL